MIFFLHSDLIFQNKSLFAYFFLCLFVCICMEGYVCVHDLFSLV